MAQAIQMGRFQKLAVVELVDGGVLLAGEVGEESVDLFLPAHQTPDDADVGTLIDVFIYGDHDGAPQATTKLPAAVLGEFALLRCVSVTDAGAYLAWGIPKDLYAPPSEQSTPMIAGRAYVVAVCMDRRGERLIASSILNPRMDYDVSAVREGDAVDLLVHGHTDAGVLVIVENRHRGLIHRSQLHRELAVGVRVRGYVHKIREDNRLDVSLARRGTQGIQDAEAEILAALEKAGGSLPLHDKSAPAEIKRALGMSKKAFKRGVGGLYKARKIEITPSGIALLKP